jgi:hypothetical protein
MADKKQAKTVQKSFYQKPVLLNAEAHKDLKFTSTTTYKHAKDIGSALLLGHEFMMVAKEFPIVFVKDANDNWDSVALMSLKSDTNLFVGKNGEWLGQYVPAVFRRYPFILSQLDGQEDYSVCFDEESRCFGKKDGKALFTETGEQSGTLKNVLNFLNEFQANYQTTQQFIAKMNELNLLKDIQGTFTVKDGEQFTLTGMWVIDEPKLTELDDKTVAELFKSGFLAWMQFHVMSLSNLESLAQRFAEFQGLKVA